MISREQVEDLRPGDVVELTHPQWPGVKIVGPVSVYPGSTALTLGGYTLKFHNGDVGEMFPRYIADGSLTIVSRAPRLYVNSDRTEPVPGDVVRDADDDSDTRVWVFAPLKIGTGPMRRMSNPWTNPADPEGYHELRGSLPARLRLLVDGTTGQAVTS